MDVRVLGPVEVWDEGRRRPLGGPMPRALFVDLVLHANEVVATDRLIDDLWGDAPSESAATALRVTVWRLRRALPPETVITQSPGYLVRLEPDQLDLYRFERLVEEARRDLGQGLPADGSDRLRRALSLWRGPALADVAYEDFAQAAIARLEELRLTTLELRLEVDLAVGRDSEVVSELEALVLEHPLRERLRAHLMLALYRSGRQAEALETFRETRRALLDELGIEPSPALQNLERAILRQDPALGAPVAASHSAPERSILVAVSEPGRLDTLLTIAEPLAVSSSRVMILAQIVPDGRDLTSASAGLHVLRTALTERDVVARVASFTSDSPGAELARLAAELDVELLLAQAPDQILAPGPFDADLIRLLLETPCDVALLVPRAGTAPDAPHGAVLVPFGGSEHDWAAVELGAELARALALPLRLAGQPAMPERGQRDASRLLSHASLAIQRVLGVPAEPVLTAPGEDGVLDAAREAGLLVVGLSSRWVREGLGPARVRIGREAAPPTLFVRRGLRPGGLAPPTSLTRFTWSVRA